MAEIEASTGPFFVRMEKHLSVLSNTYHDYGTGRYNQGPDGMTWSSNGGGHPFTTLKAAQEACERLSRAGHGVVVCDSKYRPVDSEGGVTELEKEGF